MKKKLFFTIILIFILGFNIFFIFSTVNSNPERFTSGIENPLVDASDITVTDPPDLNLAIEDSSNHTISWNLTDEGPFDYLGVYSFTDDSNGADPAGWITYEDPGTSIEVIEELAGHHKVVDIYDGSSSYRAAMSDFYNDITTGTIEFWCYGAQSGSDNYLQLILIGEGLQGVTIIYDIDAQKLKYYDTMYRDICNMSNNVWHHIRLQFNCTTDTFDIWVNGAPEGSNLMFYNAVTSINRTHFYSGVAASGGFHSYVDAVDYSWAPGYYPNRNMDVGPVDYLGAYSFTEDVDGSHPINWTVLELPTTKVEVQAEKGGHHKVVHLEMTDSEYPQCCEIIDDSWTFSQTTGTMEFWAYIHEIPEWNAGGDVPAFHCNGGNSTITTMGFLIGFHKSGNKIQYGVGSLTWFDTGAIWTEDIWQHYRVDFNCTTDTFDLFQDGIQIGDDLPFRFAQTSLQTYELGFGWPQSSNMNGSVWIDAVDYSWAPGYYPNRNMNYTIPPSQVLSYAIFINGTQQTAWQQWSGQVQVDHNVSAPNLGIGIHNVSLVYNDRNGLWYHDDIIVFVNMTVVADWNVPPSLEIEIDIGRDRDCTLSFNFTNTGNATLVDLNFSIILLPTSWSAIPYFQTCSQLDPGETIVVSFLITVGPSDKEFLEQVGINFTATVWETGEPVSDSITVWIAGFKDKNITFWIILVIGSSAAVATTSYVIIRKRRVSFEEPKLKTKAKSLASLKRQISTDFPGTYSVLSVELMERINSLKDLTDNERTLLIQYASQLDEEEALKWLDNLKNLQVD
ncbi:MAG: hypothetical protein HWN65_22010 [Candidatus Helarchaeota archaeon]|nr:hypothetical protein [Candidatus Helarchaeota archaeon]